MKTHQNAGYILWLGLIYLFVISGLSLLGWRAAELSHKLTVNYQQQHQKKREQLHHLQQSETRIKEWLQQACAEKSNGEKQAPSLETLENQMSKEFKPLGQTKNAGSNNQGSCFWIETKHPKIVSFYCLKIVDDCPLFKIHSKYFY